jgi:hypothetical protein
MIRDFLMAIVTHCQKDFFVAQFSAATEWNFVVYLR